VGAEKTSWGVSMDSFSSGKAQDKKIFKADKSYNTAINTFQV
jgi:hypothetical protein